jgi:cytochrome c-type biogenesis protein CcsB
MSVVDKGLADLSNQLMLGTVLLYVIAMVGYAADLAFGRRRTTAVASSVRERELVGVGAAEPEPSPQSSGGPAEALPRREVDWARFAVLISVVGWGVHLAELVTRGLVAERLPWGNMYEFTSAICFAAVTAYLVILTRPKARFLGPFLGPFVMLAAVIGLGVATIWLYNDPGPLRPALNSYWIAIHVSAAIVATGALAVAALTTVLYLLSARGLSAGGLSAGAAGTGGMLGRLLGQLPGADRLDHLAHRITMFAFPIWTFAIMAGAIWADQAWGRYWGWDPKETWSFITWVGYAGYLHARATAGWRGRKAAVISLIAFGCLLFNFFGINFLIEGMHSYA